METPIMLKAKIANIPEKEDYQNAVWTPDPKYIVVNKCRLHAEQDALEYLNRLL